MPTCKTAFGFRAASARVTEIAASTGPMPHTCVSKRRTCASSRSVAATTSTSRTLPLRDELASNLAVRILRGVHVDVRAVLLDRLQQRGGDRRRAGLTVRARPTQGDCGSGVRLPHGAEVDVRGVRRAGQLPEAELPLQRGTGERAGEGP